MPKRPTLKEVDLCVGLHFCIWYCVNGFLKPGEGRSVQEAGDRGAPFSRLKPQHLRAFQNIYPKIVTTTQNFNKVCES